MTGISWAAHLCPPGYCLVVTLYNNLPPFCILKQFPRYDDILAPIAGGCLCPMMRSPAFPPRRPSHLIRYIFPAGVLIFVIYYLRNAGSDPRHSLVSPGGSSSIHGQSDIFYSPGKSKDRPGDENEKPMHDSSHLNDAMSSGGRPDTLGSHPIDSLIRVAEADFKSTIAKESSSLAEAAKAYRKRRGRHPPPGFDKWYEFAKSKNAIIVEDFWDQIYHDLNPFWGIEPARIRKEAWDYEMTINVRNGNASAGSDWFWTRIWLDLIKTIEDYLPDMDLALNAMDEPRLVVPFEDISGYLEKERQTRVMPPPKEVVSDFKRLPKPGKGDLQIKTRDKRWDGTEPYWLIARRGCPPDSLARQHETLGGFEGEPVFNPAYAEPHQYQGYVSNYTQSTEFCHQPDLQGLSGIFIKPLTTSATKILFPMFGGSKLATNNEILLPAPMYWESDVRFTGGEDHGIPWESKSQSVLWRGVATGGRNTAKNWKGFQRHRFVAMNNGTKLTRAEGDVEPPTNWQLPSASYHLAAQKEGRLGDWVQSFSDTGFTDLFCHDKLDESLRQDGHCPYTDPFFEILLGQPMSVMFEYKYLPDIDGNSFSGRYLGFLRSTSLPIKSTVWREWHDSRLIAWKHFVPMDNRYGDYYGIMEYFLGYNPVNGGKKIEGHDKEAKKIAMDGKEWAEKVLRQEDMQVYVLRLLLEYGRITDERRGKMGWVQDLL